MASLAPFQIIAPGSDQVQWVTLGTQDGTPLMSQFGNLFRYSTYLDIIGTFRDTKPQKVTTLGIRLKYRLLNSFSAGKRIQFDVLIASSDKEQEIPSDFWVQGVIIEAGQSADQANDWHEFVHWFYGFPTQFQWVMGMVIRRATPWSADLMSPAVNPDVGLIISDLEVLARDPSDAPPTTKGYGTSYGESYGETS